MKENTSEGMLDSINNLKKEVKDLSLKMDKLQDFVCSKGLELPYELFFDSILEKSIFNNLRLRYGPKGKNYAGLDVKFLKLRTDFEMDDLDMVEFVLRLEEIFDVEITDEDWEKWETVNDVVRTVEHKILRRM